jgi:hypothetical protein
VIGPPAVTIRPRLPLAFTGDEPRVADAAQFDSGRRRLDDDRRRPEPSCGCHAKRQSAANGGAMYRHPDDATGASVQQFSGIPPMLCTFAGPERENASFTRSLVNAHFERDCCGVAGVLSNEARRQRRLADVRCAATHDHDFHIGGLTRPKRPNYRDQNDAGSHGPKVSPARFRFGSAERGPVRPSGDPGCCGTEPRFL